MLDRRSFLKQLAGAAMLVSMPLPAFAAGRSAPYVETRLMMGTFVSISISGLREDRASEAMQAAFARMAGAEAVLTRFDGASALGQLNGAGILRDVPVELSDVVLAASRLHRSTGGAFDPTVLPVVQALEAGADASQLAEARGLVGMGFVRGDGRSLRFERGGMRMSLDGIAKGYIADLAAKSLELAGVRDFLVNAGGDIVARGSKAGTPWKVAVEDPRRYEGGSAYPAVCSLKDRAIATSGDYESARRGFRHLVDPLGRHGQRPLSAAVTAPTAMEADALATALCVMPDPIAFIEQRPHAACCLAMPDGSVRCSSRWA